ncbi:signal peptidase II [Paramicrobacterium agarici]|uniref:signal peptidase II n=1 Tax=Paramicrobacterium agarici TaxID=630514 RepID=UPI00114EA47D|nr:signal peptidase II [Microbacterium agarici]TQO21332.1 signal peptidase II [Microbacterium agarici]
MPESPSRTATVRALSVLATVAVLWVGLDQLTKHLVVTNMHENERIPVIGDVLQFVFVRNPGAAFSLASGATWIFSILATGVVVAIIVMARRIRSVRWGLVFGLLLGGVFGNLLDRLFREPSFGLGHVVDFISTPWMMPAIYNVADIGICVAMALFIVLTLLGVGLDGKRQPKPDESAESANAAYDGAHDGVVADQGVEDGDSTPESPNPQKGS